MSLSSYLSSTTRAGIFDSTMIPRIVVTSPNLSRSWGTMVATSPAGSATLTVACPYITNSSTVVVSGIINREFVGTIAVSINSTGGSGNGAFTITSTSASDVGVQFCYFVMG